MLLIPITVLNQTNQETSPATLDADTGIVYRENENKGCDIIMPGGAAFRCLETYHAIMHDLVTLADDQETSHDN